MILEELKYQHELRRNGIIQAMARSIKAMELCVEAGDWHGLEVLAADLIEINRHLRAVSEGRA